MKTRVASFVLCGLVLGFPRSVAEENAYRIIVHPANPAARIARTEVVAIFLKTAYRWSDGPLVMPVEPRRNSPLREKFSMDFYGKPASAMTLYWNQKIFSGKGFPPLEKATDAEIVAYVKSTVGSIGYVSASADVSGVKVLALKD